MSYRTAYSEIRRQPPLFRAQLCMQIHIDHLGQSRTPLLYFKIYVSKFENTTHGLFSDPAVYANTRTKYFRFIKIKFHKPYISPSINFIDIVLKSITRVIRISNDKWQASVVSEEIDTRFNIFNNIVDINKKKEADQVSSPEGHQHSRI